MFRRIVLIAVSLVTLAGCVIAPYEGDRGYRHHHHYYDRHDWR